ncbi:MULTISPECIES: Fic family protein [unclassified Microcoleus]|uniref:Fic family protein n=1 Tax=unclassified Microcoleus TaxID=2642155 RepID=UPI001D4E3216|nr:MULTISPECIES: Fic family protein [unclassified Microcoleus]MCC3472905.1 Fic family protein [Microcoleus sp. PH2017_13_LAR_U_A]MCC3485252.1 Fic family protein [Microcoleus sp. PH2017_14_LAR_D_A]MCC3597957.1 Fic family protein [Microcoleus sp. PH2017_26_ELK_O_A]MCC3622944.1 Fic family protein [Microcoleus sp. PH2017_36_ELK_O_B]
MSTQLYDKFIQKVITLGKQKEFSLTSSIDNYLIMNYRLKLERIDKLKAWLDGFRPFDFTLVAELKKLYDVRFTYNSNAIEGNTLTQSETELVLTKGITVGGKTLDEHLEVIGHKEAIDYIENLAQKDTEINEWEIKQIHNLILRKINPEEAGSYRTLDVMAVGTNYRYPPHYLLSQLMGDFASWLNSESALRLHPVEYVSIAHYRFVSIHPFRDGNGRTARLLMNLLLIRAGYPIVVIDNQIRNDYINALAYGQQNQDDLSQLFALIFDATISSLVEVLRLLVTASSSRGKGQAFYQEITDFLDRSGGLGNGENR